MHCHLCNSEGVDLRKEVPRIKTFIQPGPTSSPALLFQVAQKWKQSQTKGAVDRPLRSVLITCLFEHLRKMLQNLKDPLLAKAKDQNWQQKEGWRYQTWSPLLGAFVPDKQAPKSNSDLMAMLETMLPLRGRRTCNTW